MVIFHGYISLPEGTLRGFSWNGLIFFREQICKVAATESVRKTCVCNRRKRPKTIQDAGVVVAGMSQFLFMYNIYGGVLKWKHPEIIQIRRFSSESHGDFGIWHSKKALHHLAIHKEPGCWGHPPAPGWLTFLYPGCSGIMTSHCR